jgi:6-pyruvoyl-tetrahydropterin synthase
MAESNVFLDYRGPLDFDIIDSLLKRLKESKDFILLNKTTGKRLYSMVVECLENICKHAYLKMADNPATYCHILARNENDKIVIIAGNPVSDAAKENISARIDHINSSDETTLNTLYEEKIDSDQMSDDRCAGLGFIYMALKSGNKLAYSFIPLKDDFSYFEIKITLNKYIMRKLMIDQKPSSPKVILDPEKKIFIISGESRPPDVREFYGQIIEWLEEFGSHLQKSDDKQDPVIFNFSFDYFNSSSGKLILDICKVLGVFRSKGFNVAVNWHFEKNDDDMLEAGKEISRIVKFPFEYVES